MNKGLVFATGPIIESITMYLNKNYPTFTSKEKKNDDW